MRLRLRLYACLEIGIFFLVLFGIAYCFDLPYNYYDFTLHPFWIIVILMAAQYGTNEGLLAAAVSAVILLAGKHPPHNYLLDSFDYLFALIKLPLLWFVTAVVLGELRFKHIREYQTVKAVAAAAERREQEIAESYQSLKTVKERLELRVAGEMETALTALHALQKLEGPNREVILQESANLIRALAAPEKFSLYVLQENKLIKALSVGWTADDHYLETFTADTPIYQEIVDRKNLLSVFTVEHSLLGTEGLAAAPLIHDGKVFGMLKVEAIPFLRLKMANIDMLRSLGEWIGKALAHL